MVRRAKTIAPFSFQLEPRIQELLLTELVIAKHAVGLCSIKNGLVPSEELINATKYIVYGICPTNPNGITGLESLLQCVIECSAGGVSVEYVWPRGCNEILQSGGGLDDQLGMWSKDGDITSQYLENLVLNLIQQDEEIFALYGTAVPLLYNISKSAATASDTASKSMPTQESDQHLSSLLKLQVYGATTKSQGRSDPALLRAWKAMLLKASLDTICLPRILLGSKTQYKDELVANSVLVDLLHKSLTSSEQAVSGSDGKDLCLYSGTEQSLFFVYVPRQQLSATFVDLLFGKTNSLKTASKLRSGSKDGNNNSLEATNAPTETAEAIPSSETFTLSVDVDILNPSRVLSNIENARSERKSETRNAANHDSYIQLTNSSNPNPDQYTAEEALSRRHYIGAVLGCLLLPVGKFADNKELLKAAEATLESFPQGDIKWELKPDHLGITVITNIAVNANVSEFSKSHGLGSAANNSLASDTPEIAEARLLLRTSQIDALNAAVTAKGNEIRDLKTRKELKEDIKTAVDQLLALKAQLAAAQAPPTPWEQDKWLMDWSYIAPAAHLDNLPMTCSGTSASLKQLLSSVCRKVRDKIISTHMANYTRVLYAAMRMGFDIPEQTVSIALDGCSDYYIEIDLSVMYRKKLRNLITKHGETTVRERLRQDTIAAQAVTSSLRDAFENTLGRQLAGCIGSGSTQHLFIFTPRQLGATDESVQQGVSANVNRATNNSSDSFNLSAASLEVALKKFQEQSRDSCAFVKFMLSSRGFDEPPSSTISVPLPCSSNGFSECIVKLMEELGDYIDRYEIWIRMHLLSVRGEEEVFSLSFKEELHAMQRSELDHYMRFLETQNDKTRKAKNLITNNLSASLSILGTTSFRELQGKYEYIEHKSKDGKKKAPDASSLKGPVAGTHVVASFRRSAVSNALAEGLHAFVVMDTLNSMANMAPDSITFETLVQVQQCFRDVPQVENCIFSTDIFCPYELSSRVWASFQTRQGGHKASHHEIVIDLLEAELRSCSNGAIVKLDDMLYAQYWLLPPIGKDKVETFQVATKAVESSENGSQAGELVVTPVKGKIGADLVSNSYSLATPKTQHKGQEGIDGNPDNVNNAAQDLVRVPCWILINMFTSSNRPFHVHADGSYSLNDEQAKPVKNAGLPVSSSTTTSMSLSRIKLSVSICKTEGSDAILELEHARIAESLRKVVEKASFRVNQRMLLEDLHDARVASPYLLEPPALKSGSLTPQRAIGDTIVDRSRAANADPLKPIATAPVKPSNISADKPAIAGEQVAPVAKSAPENRRAQPVVAPRMSVKTRKELAAEAEKAKQAELEKAKIAEAAPALALQAEKKALADAAAREAEQARKQDPLLIASFTYNKFACLKRGTIKCVLHSGGSIAHDAAVRHLETFALSQFVVTNRDKYFVTRDMQGNVFYMNFAKPLERDARVVRLVVYGITTLDRRMFDQLQQLLDDRLTDITAKTVSAALHRSSIMQSSYMTFLKESGATRHFTRQFMLPPCVNDLYSFSTIVRQIFLNMQLLQSVNFGSQKPVSISELLHPASLGYSFDASVRQHLRETPLQVSVPMSPKSYDGPVDYNGRPLSASILSVGRIAGVKRFGPPKLERTKAVDREINDPYSTNPIFFGRQKKIKKESNALGSRELEQHQVVWQQSDFTFLYNLMTQLPASSSAHLKAAAKQVGQGLALLEMCPRGAKGSPSVHHILSTGSVRALRDDVEVLERYLSTPVQATADLLAVQHVDDNAPLDTTQLILELRIYPTISMNTAGLADYCAACINEAVAVYCMGRLCDAAGALRRPEQRIDTLAQKELNLLRTDESALQELEDLRRQRLAGKREANMSLLSLASIGSEVTSADADDIDSSFYDSMRIRPDIADQKTAETLVDPNGSAPTLVQSTMSSSTKGFIFIDTRDHEAHLLTTTSSVSENSLLHFSMLNSENSLSAASLASQVLRPAAADSQRITPQGLWIDDMDEQSDDVNTQDPFGESVTSILGPDVVIPSHSSSRARLTSLDALSEETQSTGTYTPTGDDELVNFLAADTVAMKERRQELMRAYEQVQLPRLATLVQEPSESFSVEENVTKSSAGALYSDNPLRFEDTSILATPTLTHFLHLTHGVLRQARHAAAMHKDAAWLMRFSGTLHIPWTLPKRDAQTVLNDVVSEIIRRYPVLHNSLVLAPGARIVNIPTLVKENRRRRRKSKGVNPTRIKDAGEAEDGPLDMPLSAHLQWGLASIPVFQCAQDGAEWAPESDVTTCLFCLNSGLIQASVGTSSSISAHNRTIDEIKNDAGSDIENRSRGASNAPPPLPLGSAQSFVAGGFSDVSARMATGTTSAESALEPALATAVVSGAASAMPAPTTGGMPITSSLASAVGRGDGLKGLSGFNYYEKNASDEGFDTHSVVSTLPGWLRRLKSTLEIAVCPNGIFVFYSNISSGLVSGVVNLCKRFGNQAQAQHAAAETGYLQHIGMLATLPKSVRSLHKTPHISSASHVERLPSSALPKRVPEALLQACVIGLSWERKALQRLSLMRYREISHLPPSRLPATPAFSRDVESQKKEHSSMAISKEASALSSIPAQAWRRGIQLESTLIPLPVLTPVDIASVETSSYNSLLQKVCTCAGKCPFSAYIAHLARAQENLTNAFEIVHPTGTANVVFCVCPVPKTAVVLASEIKCSSDGTSVVVVHRAVDAVDILASLFTTVTKIEPNEIASSELATKNTTVIGSGERSNIIFVDRSTEAFISGALKNSSNQTQKSPGTLEDSDGRLIRDEGAEAREAARAALCRLVGPSSAMACYAHRAASVTGADAFEVSVSPVATAVDAGEMQREFQHERPLPWSIMKHPVCVRFRAMFVKAAFALLLEDLKGPNNPPKNEIEAELHSSRGKCMYHPQCSILQAWNMRGYRAVSIVKSLCSLLPRAMHIYEETFPLDLSGGSRSSKGSRTIPVGSATNGTEAKASPAVDSNPKNKGEPVLISKTAKRLAVSFPELLQTAARGGHPSLSLLGPATGIGGALCIFVSCPIMSNERRHLHSKHQRKHSADSEVHARSEIHGLQLVYEPEVEVDSNTSRQVHSLTLAFDVNALGGLSLNGSNSSMGKEDAWLTGGAASAICSSCVNRKARLGKHSTARTDKDTAEAPTASADSRHRIDLRAKKYKATNSDPANLQFDTKQDVDQKRVCPVQSERDTSLSSAPFPIQIPYSALITATISHDDTEQRSGAAAGSRGSMEAGVETDDFSNKNGHLIVSLPRDAAKNLCQRLRVVYWDRIIADCMQLFAVLRTSQELKLKTDVALAPRDRQLDLVLVSPQGARLQQFLGLQLTQLQRWTEPFPISDQVAEYLKLFGMNARHYRLLVECMTVACSGCNYDLSTYVEVEMQEPEFEHTSKLQTQQLQLPPELQIVRSGSAAQAISTPNSEPNIARSDLSPSPRSPRLSMKTPDHVSEPDNTLLQLVLPPPEPVLTPVRRARDSKRSKISALKLKPPVTPVADLRASAPALLRRKLELYSASALSLNTPKDVAFNRIIIDDFCNSGSATPITPSHAPSRDQFSTEEGQVEIAGTDVTVDKVEAASEIDRDVHQERKEETKSLDRPVQLEEILHKEETPQLHKVVANYICIQGPSSVCSLRLRVRPEDSSNPLKKSQRNTVSKLSDANTPAVFSVDVGSVLVPAISCDESGVGCSMVREQHAFVAKVLNMLCELGEVLFSEKRKCPRKAEPAYATTM